MRKEPLFLAIFASILITTYQILWKIGADGNILYLIAGFGLYGIVAVITLFALKRAEMSAVVPILGLSYFFVGFAAWYFLGETIGTIKMLGMSLVFLGVVLIGGER